MLKLTIEGDVSTMAIVIAALQAAGASSGNLPTGTPFPIASLPTDADQPGDDGPVNTNAPERDATGLPWDERIHAGTRGMNADNTWKLKRGGPKGAELAAIEAELRARVAPAMPTMAPAIPPVMPTMPPPVVPTAPPVMAMPLPTEQPAPTPVMPVMAPAAVSPDASAPSPPAMSVTPTDFASFMAHLAGQMAKVDGAGTPLIHAQYLANICAEISQAFSVPISDITAISTNQQMIAYATQLIQRDQRW